LQHFLSRATPELSERGRERAVALLQAASSKLRSSTLSSVADSVSKDPFVKIKKLIQNLIQRLLDEAKAEATKNGFCNTELGKAYKERDTRFANVRVLNAEIGELLSKKESLEDENDQLSAELKQLSSDLEEATKLREEEHDENKETVKTAKGGLEAVTDALKILKDFYAKAKKAALTQTSASPIDEDTDGPGFSGSYKGNQNRAGGVVGMLEVIQSDFDRTVRHTTQEEKDAAAEFVEFERTAKSDIAGKETKHELNEQELRAIETALEKKDEDLHDEMGVLDDVLKSVEELKPMCLDSGMSYSERRQKREEEIDALKSALCILDTDGVESECS